MSEKLVTASISSYPPRECGIATFTADLTRAIGESDGGIDTRVVAIDEQGHRCNYSSPVWHTIDQHDPRSWTRLAHLLNASDVQLLSLHHEFGLCGRFEPDGSFVDYTTGFQEHLAVPLVTTLHTVVPHPDTSLRAAIRRLHSHSDALVVMANTARLLLTQQYGIDPDYIYVIPHGVPEPETAPPDAIKKELGLAGRTVVSTFGLISRGKGLQYMLRALPEVVKHHPDVVYLVIGETHPVVRRQEGESYRESLHDLARQLGIEDNVCFVDQYLSQRQIMRYLQATDIYVTPYVNRDQITSGTLAYALGSGKAIISTPYLYATEVLAEGRGLLAECESPASLARCLRLYLEEPEYRARCAQRAGEYGAQMQWHVVGARYADLFHSLASSAQLYTQATQPEWSGGLRLLTDCETNVR
jgi:glycosyltransferase involved in cell wall biosynthesis